MTLEIYQIAILISIGALVGISISFIGQTGLGIVLPIILLFTGDVFLAIAVNLLNDSWTLKLGRIIDSWMVTSKQPVGGVLGAQFAMCIFSYKY